MDKKEKSLVEAILVDWRMATLDLQKDETHLNNLHDQLANKQTRIRGLEDKIKSMGLVNRTKPERFISVQIDGKTEMLHLKWVDGEIIIRFVPVE